MESRSTGPAVTRQAEQSPSLVPTLTWTLSPVQPVETVPSTMPLPVPGDTPAVASSPMPLPSRTMVHTPVPDTVRVSQDSIALLAYPYEAFWRDALDKTYNIPYKKFDAVAYASAPRLPVPKRFKRLLVENEFLRLAFLPELGGRLYQVLFKPTGQTLFYNNSVLKPTPWGPEAQSGWLAAGGMEWALPVSEHGYEWGVPWRYEVQGETVTLWDSDAPDRVRAQVSVTLPAHAAYFVVHPRVTNGTRSSLAIQFWINAQLALYDWTSRNVSPETEFILRGSQAFIHSTGNDFIPSANVPAADALGPSNPVPWPVIGERDLSLYRNWQDYLGFFLTNPEGLAGAYNHASKLGIARVFPREQVRGVKLFAFGPAFSGRSLVGDDDSDYFELWGGLPLTFYAYQDWPFAPGESREWNEYWIPFAQTGGLTGASQHAVLALSGGNPVTLSVACTHTVRGTLVLARNGLEIERWTVTIEPGEVFRRTVDVPSGGLALRLTGADGVLLAEANY